MTDLREAYNLENFGDDSCKPDGDSNVCDYCTGELGSEHTCKNTDLGSDCSTPGYVLRGADDDGNQYTFSDGTPVGQMCKKVKSEGCAEGNFCMPPCTELNQKPIQNQVFVPCCNNYIPAMAIGTGTQLNDGTTADGGKVYCIEQDFFNTYCQNEDCTGNNNWAECDPGLDLSTCTTYPPDLREAYNLERFGECRNKWNDETCRKRAQDCATHFCPDDTECVNAGQCDKTCGYGACRVLRT